MVPDVEFTSYYGRPVVKAAPWSNDIPAYLFLGGLAAGSTMLGAGGDLTGRPSLRRTGRIGGMVAISLSFAALVHDLGRPSRFANMLRVAKPTSPMSVGTWILTAFGPLAGLAGAAELRGLLPPRMHRFSAVLAATARPANLAACLTAPAVAAYTAALISDTATPAWHEGYQKLPFVFVGSAAAASGGLAMIGSTLDDAGPARRLALGGALLELGTEHARISSMGLSGETMHTGRAGDLSRAAKALTTTGAVLTATVSRRSRLASAIAGTVLLAGSACTRFAIFEAGQASARDPRYTIIPQRDRAGRPSVATPSDPVAPPP
jgi:formate-dependent nitrite reductase membrane component NrfD